MHEDKHNLYIFAREMDEAKSHGQLAGKGSWAGHEKAATDLQSGLKKNILEFDKQGCNKHYKIPASIRNIATLEIPSSPAREQE
ncbi:RHS repeat-associated core domain-containing protein [Pseudomonas sp. S31]|nr:RHS repeat-associated core domain-containing protein [Pseudomonas sp. S31]